MRGGLPSWRPLPALCPLQGSLALAPTPQTHSLPHQPPASDYEEEERTATKKQPAKKKAKKEAAAGEAGEEGSAEKKKKAKKVGNSGLRGRLMPATRS